MPIYPLYAVLFADTGLSGAEISALLVVWSSVAIVAEVPSGALADRFSRRGALVASAVAQGSGYVLWAVVPGFAGFAAGFVLWGLGGALASGAFEALLYDGLREVGAEDSYATVLGWVTSVGLLVQVPVAAAATGLFASGGYVLVIVVSVVVCGAAAVLATRFPEAVRHSPGSDGPGYVATLRSGVVEAAANPPVRVAVVAVAVVFGLDAFEEYFPLMARDWGVPVVWVPAAMVVISLAGAAGAACGGPAGRVRPVALGGVLGVAAVALLVSGWWRHPVGLVVVAVFYGLYRVVLVVTEARLQARIESASRATVTSVAAVGTELVALAVYGVWALGGVFAMAVAVLVVAVLVPGWLRVRVSAG